ncbi:MAG: hypothetical protein ACREMY_22015, partial [bacterium]
MNRRLLFLLSAGVALAVVAVGIGVFLVLQYQANVSQVPQGRWVRVPTAGPGQPTPTVPANGFVFKDASGASVNYAPPSATPAGFSWSIYHNDQDGYTIEYPQTWTRVDTSSEGHSGLALYPLGTDLHVDVPGGPKGIGMGWVSTFHA